uniref:Sulfotransferase n=1 Tax=Kalanchoe fedtschenkoi TaxID=63787 RepID=A0A7N1A041_KALFE
MASSSDPSNQTQQGGDHEADAGDMIISALPTTRKWTQSELKLFQGFWLNNVVMSGLPSLQENFRGKSDHVVLTSYPKSGTTWLKALLFCIMNRSSYSFQVIDDGNPLVSCNPHVSVSFIEFWLA